MAVHVRMPMGETFKSLHHCPVPWSTGTTQWRKVPDLSLQPSHVLQYEYTYSLRTISFTGGTPWTVHAVYIPEAPKDLRREAEPEA